MKKHLPLTKIGFFNPGRLSDSEIELAFIARKSFFEHVLKKIVQEREGSIPQHHLIIGQRGMGKSSLLMRIAAELRKTDYSSRFIALSFPEEQYNIDRLSKFWLNCLDALADALDKEAKHEDIHKLDVDIEKLSKDRNLDAHAAFRAFMGWVGKTGRRPVLLVDNLNLILSKISIDEQHLLRGILIEKNAPILMGTSAAIISETVDYNAPFYDAFAINYLKKLSFKESLEVLTNLAEITGSENFRNNLSTKKGRIEAIYQLTGGTPRTLTILFPMIHDGFSENIHNDLDALLDIITPLYKARFEELSDQQQIILDAVALNWDPANLEDLRDRTLLDNAKLSSQLKRLVDMGWIEKIKNSRKGGDSFELSERFFNVWYLMRRSSRRQKRELYCLTKFLETFYGSDLRTLAHSRMSCKSAHANHVALDLALADAIKGDELATLLRKKGYDELLDMSLEDGTILREFTIPSEIAEKKIGELFELANTEMKAKNYADSKEALIKLINLNPEIQGAWNNLGIIEMRLKDYPNSIRAFQAAIKINPKKDTFYKGLAKSQSMYEEFENAELNFKKAIELNPKNVANWTDIGHFYRRFTHNYREAEEAYKTAIKLSPEAIRPKENMAYLYANIFFDYHAAIKLYRQILEIDPKNAGAWYAMSIIYFDDLKDHKKGLEAAQKATKLDPKQAKHWHLLGFIHQTMGDHKKAENALKQSIAISPSMAESWNNLGNIYKNNLINIKKSEEAYRTAMSLAPKDPIYYTNLANLKREQKDFVSSEKLYKKAISIDKTYGPAWLNLSSLYFINMKKGIEGETLLKKYLETSPNDEIAFLNLGHYYVSIKEFKQAEDAFRRAISINSDLLNGWYHLGKLYQYSLKDLNEAQRAYRKLLEIEPENVNTLHHLGQVYQDTGKYLEAEKIYRKLLKINEQDIVAWMLLGNVNVEHLGRADIAVDIYRRALKIDDKVDGIWFNLALALRQIDTPESLKEAEFAIMKAIKIAPDETSWTILGLILNEIKGREKDAIEAYKNSISIKPTEDAINNLVFLLRDKAGKTEEARAFFDMHDIATLKLNDCYLLNQALFSYYEKNIGSAEESISKALEFTDGALPEETFDDWYRTVIAVEKLGYLESLIEVFANTGNDIILRPIFEAMKAINAKDEKLYLNSIAAEVREATIKVLEKIETYR